LAFGRLESSPSFVGCLGDVLFGGQLMSLAQGSANELTLSGCTLADVSTSKEEDEGIDKESGDANGLLSEKEEKGETPKPGKQNDGIGPTCRRLK
jgi:hypothetical protein